MAKFAVFPNDKVFEVNDNMFINGTVLISVGEMVNSEMEEFLDILSERLVGDDLLMDFSYEPLRVEDGMIVMTVVGDATATLCCKYGQKEEEYDIDCESEYDLSLIPLFDTRDEAEASVSASSKP